MFRPSEADTTNAHERSLRERRRQRELAIGKYPAMSLADARAKRAELREAKDRGLDPKGLSQDNRIVRKESGDGQERNE